MDKDLLSELKQEARTKAIIEIETWKENKTSNILFAVYPKKKPMGKVVGIDLKNEQVILA
ncbi:MAG: hypothetical protein GY718_20470 [Lentisphaerae bacterium]|nr:hypothetical protein [Lentisphaerota bacterium]